MAGAAVPLMTARVVPRPSRVALHVRLSPLQRGGIYHFNSGTRPRDGLEVLNTTSGRQGLDT